MNIIIEEIVVNPLIQIEETIEEITIAVSEMQIPGVTGADGKSAYQSALDGGFVGTELEFNQSLAEILPHIENVSNPHNVTKLQIGLGNVDNTSDTNKPVSTATQTALNLKEDSINKGASLGYAPLDVNSKVPLENINDALLGNVHYQGLWNATINTPNLDIVESKGHYYICTNTTEATRYGIVFNAGDWIISDGTNWGKVDNTDAVSSVFGRVGNVTAQSGDYNTSQVTETTDKRYQTDNQKLYNDATSSIQTQLNSKANNLDVVKNIIIDTTTGTPITNTTQETVLFSALIPANSFKNGDFFNIKMARIGKIGTAGNLRQRFKINIINSLVGSTYITDNLASATILNAITTRSFSIENGSLKGYAGSGAQTPSDLLNTVIPITSYTFDPTIDNYIFEVGILGNASDSMFHSSFLLTN